MTRRARATPGSLAVLLILVAASVLVCTLLLLRDAYRGGLSGALGADGYLQPGEYHAVLLVQPTDCGTRLEVLHALGPVRKPRGITASALVVGPAPRAKQVIQLLRSHGNELPVRHRGSAPRGLQVLGYTRTPFIIVFDSAGRVRLATPAPTAPAELTQFEHLLAALSGAPPSQR